MKLFQVVLDEIKNILTENPDAVQAEGMFLHWKVDGTYAFFEYNKKVYVGKMHSELYLQVLNQTGEIHTKDLKQFKREIKYSGRVWTKEKIISFWDYPEDGIIMRRIMREVGQQINVDIIGDKEYKVEVYENGNEVFVPLHEYEGEDYDVEKIDHTDKPEDKYRKKQAYIKRNKKVPYDKSIGKGAVPAKWSFAKERGIAEEVIQEDVEEIREIGLFSDDILKTFLDWNENLVLQVLTNPQSVNIQYPVLNLINVADQYGSKYNKIKSFLYRHPIHMVFHLVRDNSSGEYVPSKKIIVIHVGMNFISQLSAVLRRMTSGMTVDQFKSIDKTEVNKYVIELFDRGIGEIITHELQHAFDDYKSGGKFSTDKESNKYYNKIKSLKSDEEEHAFRIENYKTYLNLHHEVWARLSQTLKRIRQFLEINPDVDFKEVFDLFKDTFYEYDSLNPENKKRILKVLFKFYEETK